MLWKRKKFCTEPFLNKGSMLITLIVTMVIFSILAVAMLSLTSTSMFSQLNTSSTTGATYIAKSGYNYLASVYKNASNEAAKNLALETLNNVTFQLLNNKGSFLLNVQPSYLKSLQAKTITATSTTLDVKFPGAVPNNYVFPTSGTMAVYTGPGTGTLGCGYTRFTYTGLTTPSPPNYHLTGVRRVDTSVTVSIGTSIVPVLTTPASAQTLNNTNYDYLTVTGASGIYPLRFGFFEIPQLDTSNVYSYDHRTGNIFYGIRNARDPTTSFSYTINNRMIYVHTSAAITSTGTFNPGGSFTTSNTFSRTAILGYTPGGNGDYASPYCANGVPEGYTKCGVENGTCLFSGTKYVAYGAASGGICYYYYLNTTSLNSCPGPSHCCDNATFTDPIVGTVKACYYR